MRKLSICDIRIAQYRAKPVSHIDVAICGTIAFIAVIAIYAYLVYSAVHTVAATFRIFS